MNGTSISEAKATMRASVRNAVSGMTRELRAQAAKEITQAISSHPIWHAARTVMLFSPLPDEPPIGELLPRCLHEGKTACLPRYRVETGSYEAAIVRKPEVDLKPARFGIPEPKPECPALPLNQLDLVFVPGVAFAPGGARLGRGRGFYDRILAAVTSERVGVAFNEQLLASIPMERHDVHLTGVVTPARGWLRMTNEKE